MFKRACSPHYDALDFSGLADRTATQYDRLLACTTHVSSVVRPTVCLMADGQTDGQTEEGGEQYYVFSFGTWFLRATAYML